jgi:ribonucleotide monophosphatase NagD (HAD superfamily)
MGALRASLQHIYETVTGKPLTTTAFGKPQLGTFQYAARLLAQWRKDTHRIDAPPNTVYFVGDTPESDVRGTNEYDATAANEWHSILVRTGVYEPRTTPAHAPRVTVDTVLDAVRYGIEREWQRELEERANALVPKPVSPPATTVASSPLAGEPLVPL